MVRKVLIKNYRTFKNFELDFSPGLNVIVGDNDAGKSTLLEAVNLALKAQLRGNSISYEMSPYLFNQSVTREYISQLRAGKKPPPPEILIEVYLDDDADYAELIGANNLLRQHSTGVRLKILLDDAMVEAYQAYIATPEKVTLVPTEYYTWEWMGFDGNPIRNARMTPDVSLIDATAIRLQHGADQYMQDFIGRNLEASERAELSRSYRSLRETFAAIDTIKDINAKLAASYDDVSSRDLSLSIDASQRAAWERALVPHLNEIPFQFIGSGEQSSLKIRLALSREADDSHVILVEEPENHLSFSSLNVLMHKISERCGNKQVLVTTHSSYVLNKLGLENLILLAPAGGTRLTNLRPDTVDYFKKLPGYDTLRMVLAKRVILVEGPSDELIVQRAYRDANSGRMPIDDGIDVISVRGVQAKRFLDIAVLLKKPVAVVNDNDGDPAEMAATYADYTRHDFIQFCIGQGDARTLEPQMLAANGLEAMNRVLGKNYTTEQDLLIHMKRNKTDCALKAFETNETIIMPEYIRDAISE